MRIYLASGNAGKLREFRTLFDGAAEVVLPDGYEAPEESAQTYEGNAELKARALAARLREREHDAVVLADDSGIEVEALGGEPGVRSARYGGANASWRERRARLLEAMADVPKERRSARFVDVLYLDRPDRQPLIVRGEVEGLVPEAERGEGGFSYDAVFYFPPLSKTFAELSEEEKNRVSHRGAAVRALLEALRA